MMTGSQLTDADAAEWLVTAWNQMHVRKVEAWDLQVQTDMTKQEELQRLAQVEEERLREDEEHQKDEEKKELEKKQPKINDFDNEKMVGDFVLPHPSQFAIGKLKLFSFTELWSFTEEGCSKAQESSRTLPDDMYGRYHTSQCPGCPKACDCLQSLKKHHTRHQPVRETDEYWQEHDASTYGTVQLAPKAH